MYLFIYKKEESLIILLVYLDDILVTGNQPGLIDKLIADLNQRFALKKLGSLYYFMGIEAYRDESGLYLCQAKYIVELLKKTKMDGARGYSNPAAPGQTLFRDSGEAMDNPQLYRSIVGVLQYLTITRLDISYIVGWLSQFLQSPTVTHWQACKRVLRYLKDTIKLGISFQPSKSLMLQGFTDVDFAACPDDRRSISAYCVFLGGCLLSWKSKKQTLVANSVELAWLKSMLSELKIEQPWKPIFWCDHSIGTTSVAANPIHMKEPITLRLMCILLEIWCSEKN